MATGGCVLTSDEIINFKCTLCAKRNRNREAVKYCAECQGYCCQSCVEVHQDIPALVNHNLLDKSSFKSTVLKTDLPAVPTERCSVHETKIVDMYCQNHDEVGCTTCMALNHRSCKDLKSIPDIMEAISQKSDVQKTLFTLKDKQTLMGTVKKNRDKLLQELKISKEEAVNTIKNFRKEMERLLEYMEKESINRVEDESSKMESSLKHDMQTAEEEGDALQKAKNDLQNAEGNRAQEFVCMKIAKKKMESIEAIVRSLQAPKDAKVLFSANQEIINFLQQMKSFGSVQSCRLGTFSTRKTLCEVKDTREINIRTQNDTSTCCVLDSCLTQYGMLLLADHGNKKLKRVDLVQMVVVDQFKLDNKPCGVCCVTKQEAAVSVTNSTVQFVSLGNQMKLSRQIKLDHNCYGIAYHDYRLYITDHLKSLYIHDMIGNVLQTVTKDNSGNDLFTSSRYIAINDNGDKVFVTNFNDGVVALDADGTYIDTLSDGKLIRAFGVCADSCGNILVSGCSSHNVVQISQDGKERFGEVVKKSDRISNPYSVTVNPYGGTLLITQYGNDRIKLLDLL